MENFTTLFTNSLEDIKLDSRNLKKKNSISLDENIINFIKSNLYNSHNTFNYGVIDNITTYDTILEIINFFNQSLYSSNINLPNELEPYLLKFMQDNFNFNLTHDIKNAKLNQIILTNIPTNY